MKDQAFPSDGAETGRRSGRAVAADGGVVDFASWVVALLAARKQAAAPRLRPSLLAAFRAALVDDDAGRLDLFMRDLVRQKVTAGAVADLYIPAVARALGEDWMEDRASFLEVTLATARMQALLRAIGTAWTADTGSAPDDRALLLVVPAREQHTLGAMVLLGQLRRIGISVRLLIGPGEQELGAALRGGTFRGALISAACADHLAEIQQLVAQMRAACRVGLPIVVGGHVVECGKDVLALTGADAVATSLGEALAVCGMEVDHNSTPLRA